MGSPSPSLSLSKLLLAWESLGSVPVLLGEELSIRAGRAGC